MTWFILMKALCRCVVATLPRAMCSVEKASLKSSAVTFWVATHHKIRVLDSSLQNFLVSVMF
jgi:hypothetical protein